MFLYSCPRDSASLFQCLLKLGTDTFAIFGFLHTTHPTLSTLLYNKFLITNTQGLESGLKTLPRYQFQLVSASGLFTPSVICTAQPLRSLTHRSQTRNCMGTHALNHRGNDSYNSYGSFAVRTDQ
jgi:hypothetical protein